uniref:Tyramine receptor ser-2-like n=1 Tax=Saccoglossus kowalevskii TaxID=10224 RepID=A0ABM0MQF2_SACKO|nr:PREDICTED: tyramine receptor ser-2-like [Saccoglossus kowalevskii]
MVCRKHVMNQEFCHSTTVTVAAIIPGNLVTLNSNNSIGMYTYNGTQYYLRHDPKAESSPWEIIMVLLITIIMFVGNLTVILVFIIYKELRSRQTNYLILNLAVTDWLLSILVMPFHVTEMITGNGWYFGYIWCVIWLSLENWLNFASILSLIVISLDRYIYIQHPYQYIHYITFRTILIEIVLVWLLSLACVFIPGVSGSTSVDEFIMLSQHNICEPLWEEWWTIISFILGFVIPFIVLSYTNIRITCTVKKQSRQICAQMQGNAVYRANIRKSQFKSIKTTVILVVLFCVMWLPYYITTLLYSLEYNSEIVAELYYYFSILTYCNSAINPFMYAHNKDFRKAYNKFMMCKFKN